RRPGDREDQRGRAGPARHAPRVPRRHARRGRARGLHARGRVPRARAGARGRQPDGRGRRGRGRPRTFLLRRVARALARCGHRRRRRGGRSAGRFVRSRALRAAHTSSGLAVGWVVTTATKTDIRALAAGLITVTAWASAFVAIRGAKDTLSPGSIALGRLLV